MYIRTKNLFFITIFCLTSSFAAHSEECQKQESVIKNKIELIKSEVSYAKYIAWQTRKKLIPAEDGLLWIEGILEIVQDQLDDINEG